MTRQDVAISPHLVGVAAQFGSSPSRPIERDTRRQVLAEAKTFSRKVTDDMRHGRNRHVPDAVHQPAPAQPVVTPVAGVRSEKNELADLRGIGRGGEQHRADAVCYGAEPWLWI